MNKIFRAVGADGFNRRTFIEGGAALVAAGLPSISAIAQEKYPSREVRVIAAFPPGSGADVFTRYFAENMRPFLGGTVIVENKVGASGNLAINFVALAGGNTTFRLLLGVLAE